MIRGEVAKTFGQDFANQLRILYGGSVKPENVKALMAEAEIDGALVGGASLDPKSFASIVNYLESSPFAIINAASALEFSFPCGSGGTGRHTILRGWRRKAWGFKSPLPHQI